MIRAKNSLKGKLNNAIVHEYPELEDLTVTPTMEEQRFKSDMYGYNEITVIGEPNLVPENIPEGVEIFGVKGDVKILDTSDATATAENVIEGKTAYVNGKKITGNIPNNQELNYVPSEVEQIIPAGYTSGGKISAIDITTLNDYQSCLVLSKEIVEGGSVE